MHEVSPNSGIAGAGAAGEGRTHRARPHADRARQFMPFAALTGYERVIEQAACDAEAAVARADAAGDTDFGA